MEKAGEGWEGGKVWKGGGLKFQQIQCFGTCSVLKVLKNRNSAVLTPKHHHHISTQ